MVWFLLSLVIALILLNLLIAVIGWLFEDILGTYVESNQLAKAQLLASLQCINLSKKQDTSLTDKCLVTSFYPTLPGEEQTSNSKPRLVNSQGIEEEEEDETISDGISTQMTVRSKQTKR